LERVERGEITRLLILMPPRHLKSHTVSVAFTAWALGRNPARQVSAASYGADLAETFGADVRRLFEASWHRAVFPGLHLDKRKANAHEMRTTENGVRLAPSVGGPFTGKGCEFLIFDDPMKAEDASSQKERDRVWDWFTGTAMTRLNDPKNGAIVVVAQRLHEDDLPGRLIPTGDWEVLELPAIETRDRKVPLGDDVVWARTPGKVLLPEHMGRPELDRIRRQMGSATFEAQYQQAPSPAGGNIIRPEWFRSYQGVPRRSDYEAVLQSWDTAAVPGESNDYSVCTTWGLIGNHIDLLDVHRRQYLYPDLLRVAIDLRRKWKPNLVVIEKATTGLSLKPDLVRKGVTEARWLPPEKGKVERAVAQSEKLASGQVRLPVVTPWKEGFVAEAGGFPNAKYDDQVDSMSQALRALDWQPHELRHCSRYKG
jgi:predicted phage terminase large subunit-like protein